MPLMEHYVSGVASFAYASCCHSAWQTTTETSDCSDFYLVISMSIAQCVHSAGLPDMISWDSLSGIDARPIDVMATNTPTEKRARSVCILEFSRTPAILMDSLLSKYRKDSINPLWKFRGSESSEDQRVHECGAMIFVDSDIFQAVHDYVSQGDDFRSRHVFALSEYVYLIKNIVFADVPAKEKTYEKQKNRMFISFS